MLIFEDEIRNNKPAFVEKVQQIADDLDIDPNWLMAVMYIESRLNPAAQNPYSKAIGLIQWLPSTLQSKFGMTTLEMAALNNVQQLYYVHQYLLKYRNNMTSYVDVYLAVFYPAAIGKDDDYALPASVYSGNQNVDMDQDGKITVADIKQWIMKNIPSSWKKVFEEHRSVFEKFFRRNWIGVVTIALLVMALTYFALTQLYT